MNDDRAKDPSRDAKRARGTDDAPRGSEDGSSHGSAGRSEVDATTDPTSARSAGGEAEPTTDLPVDVGPASEASVAPGDSVDFRDRWLRAEADLQNYRRRAQRDADESRRSAEDRLLREVIEVLDDLDRALEVAPQDAKKTAPQAASDDRWLTGVNLVAGKIRELLARAGVTPIEALGRPFDPHEHEALLEVEAPQGSAPGDVVNVVRPGYRRGDRVLRPARVVVARARVEAG